MTTESCLFCKIVNGEIPGKIAYDDEHVVAFHDVRPVAPVHVLVVPRVHLESVRAATDGEGALLGHVMTGARKAAEKLGLAEEGYRLVVNNGAHAGQTVFHLHVHVLGGRNFAWPPG